MTMIFIRSTTAFYVVRFLLGIAEAGFFPGVILYLTYWYPSKERAHTIALFYTGSVIAGIVGSPLSGAILGLHGKIGLDGWQWLFLLEGIPAVLMAVVVFLFLPNGPQKVKWLSQGEKKWIQSGSMMRSPRKRVKQDIVFLKHCQAVASGFCALYTFL